MDQHTIDQIDYRTERLFDYCYDRFWQDHKKFFSVSPDSVLFEFRHFNLYGCLTYYSLLMEHKYGFDEF